MQTPATERLQNALRTYSGVTEDPTYSEYWGYESVDGFVTGLKAAGSHPTRQSFISAMLSIRSYNPAGLYGNQSVGFAMDQRGQAAGVGNCFWITKYEGDSFHLVPGMDPLCGSIVAGRPGYFNANLSAVNTRPKWEMEALVLHEAVPGHHLQLALAQERTDLPEFRRYGYYTAFGEGWGLYAETLGYEMGFYKDPYAHFGALNYQMWRAIRLVVDTGIHALGWSRQQAIDYFKANSAKSEREITVEIDRYIVAPGQALAYKIGQRKFLELRARAARELGAKFDLRRFHDAVLAEGALPLDVLEARIDEWIAQQRQAPAAGG